MKDEERKPVNWLTVAEVAAQLRLHVATVYEQVRLGNLPAVRIGRAVRIRADALEAFLAPGRPAGKEGQS